MPDSNPIVIAGAGMTGMMAALLLCQHHPHRPIIIIEPAALPGGNYRCIDYGPHGKFDQGMRMLYETGIAEFDTLLHSLLPESEWHILAANRKDIAGIFWNGALQTYSQYIDLRRLPPAEFAACKEELLRVIDASSPLDSSNAKTYLHSRFGPRTGAYLCAALEKLHALPAEQLDIMTAQQPAMDRVILFDEKTLQPLMQNPALRAHIAWPDQLTLPVARTFNQSALYPKTYGLDHVIDRLQARLERENVSFIFGDSIEHLATDGQIITQLTTRKGTVIEKPLHVYWTGSLPALARLQGVMDTKLAPPPEATLVHLTLRNKPTCETYHFYCLDAGFHTFRITYYTNYCPAAEQPDGYPICIELWHLAADDAGAKAVALAELCTLGIIDSPADAVVKGIARTPNLHSLCSLKAVETMRGLRQAIAAQTLANLTPLGVFSEDNQLLLYDVWKHMYGKIIDTVG